MQRSFTTFRVALLALFTFLSLSCSGGGPTDPRTGEQLSLGIEFRPLAATQTSPIIPLTVDLAPTGTGTSAQVFVRMVYKRPAQSTEYVKMTAAPGSRNVNATGVTITVPPGGTSIEFLWDAFADLGPNALQELVILRAGVLNADADDPREAQCTIEPSIEVTYADDDGVIAECGLAPKLDGGALPDAFRGVFYDETVPLRDGLQPPLRWEQLNPGTGEPIGNDLGNGLTLNTETGTISGLVDEDAPASVTLLLRVSDACSAVRDGEGRSAEQLVVEPTDQFDQEFFTLRFLNPGDVTCFEPAPALNVDSMPSGAVGQPYDFQTPASGGTGGLNFIASGLPAGLSMSTAGQVTGTPTEIGVFNVDITVSDNCPESRTDSGTFTLIIIDPNACAPLSINPLSPPVGDVGVPYSLTAIAAGGAGTLTWSATGLPPGLTIGASDGAITGTPTTAGSFPFTVQVTDSCANPEPQTAQSGEGTIIINPVPCPAAPAFSNLVCQGSPEPCDLPDAFLGAPYNTVVTVSVPAGGGVGQILPAAMPDGITVTAENNGTSVDFNVTGTPTDADDVGQTFAFSLSVTDACATGPQTTTRSFRLFVDETLNPCPEEQASILASGSPDTLPDANADTPYAAVLDVTGGTLPLGAISIVDTTYPTTITIDTDGRTLLANPTSKEVGDWIVTLTVTDSCTPTPRVTTTDFAFTVLAGCGPTPTVTTPSPLPDATRGVPYSVTLEGANLVGAATWSIVIGSLPVGLTLAPDGTISGTTNDPVGPFTFTVTARDSCPSGPRSAIAPMTLNVVELACPTAPQITTAALPNAVNGTIYNFQLLGSGGVLPIDWDLAVGSGNLPSGLTLEASGRITGTPSDKPGDYDVTILMTDSCSEGAQSDTADLTLTLDEGPCAPLVLNSDPLPNAQFGTAYFATISILGGQAPFTTEVTVGALPSGLTVDDNGSISGTPDDPKQQGSNFPFTLTVTDNCANPEPQTQTIDLAIRVDAEACDVLVFDPQTLPNGDFGLPYSQQLVASGGEPPFTFTLQGLSVLPGGLALSAGGLISGTPNVPFEAGQTFNFSVQVEDTCAVPAPQRLTQAFSITINPIITPCTPLSITTETLPDGVNGQIYTAQLESLGGEGTLTWELDGESSLPSGLTLSTDGRIGGLPDADPATYDFVVNLTDQCDNPEPQTTSALLSLTITDPVCASLNLTTPSLPDALLDQPYSALVEAIGGQQPYTFSLGIEDFLPPGLDLAANGAITGTVIDPQLFGQTFDFDIVVTDSCTNPGTQTATRPYSITISAEPCDALVLSPALPFTFGQGANVDVQLPFSGGEGTLFWEITEGGLPAGVSLTQAGRLEGSIDDESGTYPFTVQVTDECIFEPQIVQQGYTIIVSGVACQPFVLEPTTLTDPIFGDPYVSAPFDTLGGISPFTFRVVGGSLPTGISLLSTGQFSGAASNPLEVDQLFTFTVEATDSCTGTGGPARDTEDYSFTLQPPNCPSMGITTTGLPPATVGEPYSFQLQASGGILPILWLQDIGSQLPIGLGLASDGTISGTPDDEPGDYTLNVRAIDNCAIPQQDTASFPLTLNPAVCPTLDITTLALPDAVNGRLYSEQVQASGGFGTLTWSLGPNTSIPNGLTFNSSGVLSGIPSDEPATYTLEVIVTDSCEPAQTDTQFVDVELLDDCVPVSITTEALPSPVFGSPYSEFVETSGGTDPLAFEILEGPLPTGLTLDPETGEISGTPNEPDDIGLLFDVVIGVTDSCPIGSTSDSANYRLVVQAPDCPDVFITTTGLPPATNGVPYSFQLGSLGGVAPLTWSEGPNSFLPDGLTLNPDGSITGTPDDGASVYDVEIVVTDSCALPQSATIILPLTLNDAGCPALIITTEDLPDATFGVPYSAFVESTGGVAPLTYQLNDSQMPQGLGLNSLTGEISGTPDSIEDIDQDFSIRVEVTDSCTNPGPQSEILSVSIVVLAPNCPELGVTTLSLPDATQGVDYFAQLESIGGFGTIVWRDGPGTEIPEGLTVNSNGTITGVTQDPPGVYDLVIEALDNCPTGAQTARVFLPLTVLATCAPLSIATTGLPNAIQNQQYDFQFQANGGEGNLTWSIPIGAGGPPPGLSMQTDGLLTGIPTSTGTFSFPVRVVDECDIEQQSAQGLFNLTVDAPACPDVEITSTTPLPNGEVQTPYAFQFAASGGTGTLSWAVAPGPSGPPPGLTLNPSGLLSGTPLIDGTFTFPVIVRDSCPLAPRTDTEPFTITIDTQACPALAITTEALPNATEGQPYSFFLEASGGVPPLTWRPGAGTQAPEGMDFSSEGEIFGTPGEFGSFSVFAVVNDNCIPPQEDVQGYLFTILPSACNPLSITTASLPAGQVGSSYFAQLESAGGSGTVTWSVSPQTPLPAGMLIAPDGRLLGTPQQSGEADILFIAQDQCPAGPQSATRALLLSINDVPCAPLNITTEVLPTGTEGEPYSFQMGASGGFGTLTWSLIQTFLPPGLTLSPSGLISGTPLQAGGSDVVIGVSDQCPSGTQSDSQSYFFLIEAGGCAPLNITTTQLPIAYNGLGYNFQLTADGGEGSLIWVAGPGSNLPPVITLDSSGKLSGPVDSSTGSFTLNAVVRDNCSPAQTDSQIYILEVRNSEQCSQINVLPDTISNPKFGTEYLAQLSMSGGQAPGTWSLFDGSLPQGLSLTAGGFIAGVPSSPDQVNQTFIFTARVIDSCTAPGGPIHGYQQYFITLTP